MVSSNGIVGLNRRVILLGASNATRGLRTICATSSSLWGYPLDVMAAIGFGRSYGITSCVFGRTLPSIRDCELWEDWQSRESLPTAAVITDIGNDIMYGSTPSKISEWVEECATRLVERCQRVVMTGLPMDSILRIGPRRFKFLRAILFPSSSLTLELALDRAQELNARVSAIANALKIEWTTPDASWFGFDPIHIRWTRCTTAWQCLLGPLRDTPQDFTGPPRSAWRLRRMNEKHRWILGVEQRWDQPIWKSPDGSQVSLY